MRFSLLTAAFLGCCVCLGADDQETTSLESAQRPQTNAQETTHSFLACGQKTYIMGADGNPTWTYPAATRDGYVLEDGTVILTLSKSERYRGGAVISIAPDGSETLIWKGTQSEVNSAQPTADQTLIITEAGANPRLLEVSATGDVLVEFPLACQTDNHHMQTRMARRTSDGTFLAPHLLDFAVYEYSREGKVRAKLETTAPGDTEHKIHTWPFTAIRHGDGHTLVTCTHGNRVVDFDASGRVVWTLTNEDLPGNWLQDPCGAQVLPNGNIVITSYAAGQADPNAPKLFEVNRDKKVLWQYADGQKVGIHHFQIITTNGEKLRGLAQK
ncbi:MAG: PQQ-like beta-propeller repeat protein [Planctomycetaceae bacterium]|nr:PQQ-like beta-propeller repeat protein [Planctomycetaceae bacterium]